MPVTVVWGESDRILPPPDGVGARVEAGPHAAHGGGERHRAPPALTRRSALLGGLGGGAAAALALVHRLHPRRRGSCGPPRRDRRAARCGAGHELGPRVAVAEQVERGVDGEVGRRHLVELVPRAPGTTPARPGGPAGCRPRRRRAADAGRVDEHLAAAVLLDERRGGDVGVELARRARRSPGWRRRRPRAPRRARSARTTCTPLAPLVFTAPASPTSASACADELGGGHGQRRSPAPVGRVEVEHEVGRRGRGRRPRTSVGWYSTARWLANHSSVAPVVAQRVGDVALRRLGPHRHRAHEVGRVLGEVLLHERRPGPGGPDHRQRPVAQHGQDPVGAPRRGSRRGRAWSRSAPSNSGWSRLVSATPSRVSSVAISS